MISLERAKLVMSSKDARTHERRAMKRRSRIVFLMLLSCVGCLVAGVEASGGSEKELDVLVALQGDEPPCREARVYLELFDHGDRIVQESILNYSITGTERSRGLMWPYPATTTIPL